MLARNVIKENAELNYLIVVPVQFFELDGNTFACESAFAKHLKILKNKIALMGYKRMYILASLMPNTYYQTNKGSMATIDSLEDEIYFQPAYPSDSGRLKYLFVHLWSVIPKLWGAVRNAGVVHAGPSQNIFHPFEIIAIIYAVILRKKTIFVVDIDERNSAKMLYATGAISKKSYLLMRYLYDPFLSLQLRFASKFCTLCLLKGQSLVDTYGKGSNVRNFLDTAHSAEHILTDRQLDAKVARYMNSSEVVNITYFGRLTAYKGIKDMLLAVSEVAKHSNVFPNFVIVGDGEQRKDLEELTNQLDLNDHVTFMGALPYGKKLFDCLYQQDILLAAPLREDTPRSLFDAMAAGLLTVAYDTYYYVDMAKTGAVITVPWRDTTAMANAIIESTQNRRINSDMMVNARNFALENTQDVWLEKRLSWMQEAIGRQ